MKVHRLHSWSLSPIEAAALQRKLASRLSFTTPDDLKRKLRDGRVLKLAAADISHERFSHRLFAAAVVMTVPGFEVLEVARHEETVAFPYVPGLLAFREAPVVLGAMKQLRTCPDALVCDGHGLAHPRGFGVACHVGLHLDVPVFGVAKSPLTGTCGPLDLEKGSSAKLTLEGAVVGRALRTRDGVKPVYVSCGHRISLEDATALAFRAALRARLPEPSRFAHQEANRFRIEAK